MAHKRNRIQSSLALMLLAVCSILGLHAQSGNQGDLVLTVQDGSGAVVSDAALVVRDKSTNVTRSATTLKGGTYTFSGLDAGDYTLTVGKPGFKDVVFDSVVIQASRVTDLSVPLAVGSVSEKVEVTIEQSPILEASSNVIGTTIDLKQIEELPMADRDPTQFTAFVAGYNSAGHWDNEQHQSEVTSSDGVIANSSRFKAYGAMGSGAIPVTPRLQNVQEVTVQTSGLTASQGYGQAAMQTVLTTRRGSNAFHGRAFMDLQNSSLDANSWTNDYYGIPKALYHKEDFGGSMGGRILKDKLFFFGSYEQDQIPGKGTGNDSFLTPSMQRGNYVYEGTDGASHTVNLLQLAGAAGLQSTLDTGVAAELAKINAALPLGTATDVVGADQYESQNVQNLAYHEPNNTYYYDPTIRIDYNMRQNLSIDAVFNAAYNSAPTALFPSFPGPDFDFQRDGVNNHNYTAGIGVNWQISPTLINQFQGGYLYNYNIQAPNSAGLDRTHNIVWWNGPWNLNYGTAGVSGDFFYSTISSLYPLVSFNDNLLWQKKSHSFTFGVSFYREQDHYWNPPQGYSNITFGMGAGDPGLNVFSTTNPALATANGAQLAEMQSYYALLTGDIASVGSSHPINAKTHQYQQYGALNLDELQKATGLFFQDSWRPFPNLTLNYGLRWDFTGDDHDLNGLYYSPTSAGLWGPSGVNNAFNPGSFKGEADPSYISRGHAYAPWNVSPQPNVGFAWSPQGKGSSLLDKLIGNNATVVRGGFSLRRYTPQYQDYWAYASNTGSFFYQNDSLNASNTPATGYFTAGTQHLANFQNGTFPNNYFVNPSSYSAQITEASQFGQAALEGMDPHIRQPYTESWNFGIQRELGKSNAIEIRYIGNRGIHEWMPLNLNEVNIFENGFLVQFKNAQAALAANGGTSFQGPAGSAPILDTAFADNPTGGYTYGGFIYNLQHGQVGSMAAGLSTPFGATSSYFCNLVPSSFTPCQNLGYTGSGGTYASNLFQVNPYQAGSGVGYLTAAGYSNYNALEVEFRQQTWHGMHFTGNYTWSRSFGMNTQYTLRNLGLAYGPTASDIHNVIHVIGTYDLPLGKGKAWLNHSAWLDRAVGGWTLGTTNTYQSGAPFQIPGGNQTYNNLFDGGLNLTGVTAKQLQHDIHFHPVAGNSYEQYWLDPKYITSGVGTNSAYLSPNSTPGSIGTRYWFWGNHQFLPNSNVAITKSVPIAHEMRFSVQAEMLDVFNHPVWNIGDTGAQDASFGESFGKGGGSRSVEIRANLEF